ncbi:ribonuclease HI family protein [Fructilactobacillus vespulae]|uniref:ribonuclease HI family protein n=1 Tax=Fructilactobacillus vespulae TaxID=1249630 RepID=UPI0039B59FDF
MFYKIYSDAAKKPNDTKTGISCLIIFNHKQLQFKKTINTVDNHEAEFKACLFSLEQAQQLSDQSNSSDTILFYTDSEILANSLEKQYAKHYQTLVDEILILENNFSLIITNWIPESKNKGAHNLAQQALHLNE